MHKLRRNIVYLDGANAVGKTYAIGKIVEGAEIKYPGIKTRVVSIKEFYGDIAPSTLAKIYSYKLQVFTHCECMRILSKHKLMLEYIDSVLASGEYDLVIVDRCITSFMVYQLLISRTLYAGHDIDPRDEYDAETIFAYIHKEIRPLLTEQNSLYVHLRFNLHTGLGYTDEAITKTIKRLEARGVGDYEFSKITAVLSLMERYHGNLYSPDEDDYYLLSSASSLIHSYFHDVINTDSGQTDLILERL